ncbi:hypothetical protein DXG01_013698, partial [Tephrocybe rancida]
EIRIADYLTSYRTSGRPPSPPRPSRHSNPSPSPPCPGPHQCIGAMGAFVGFSHEVRVLSSLPPFLSNQTRTPIQELRVYAYIARHKDPPPGTPMSSFVRGPSLAAQAQGTLSSSSNSRSGNGGISAAQAQTNAAAGLPPTNGDQMLTISARARWAGHRLEVSCFLELVSAVLRTDTSTTPPLLRTPIPLSFSSPSPSYAGLFSSLVSPRSLSIVSYPQPYIAPPRPSTFPHGKLHLVYLQSGRELTSSEICALLTSAPSSLPVPISASTSTPAPSTPGPVNPFARPLGGRLFSPAGEATCRYPPPWMDGWLD